MLYDALSPLLLNPGFVVLHTQFSNILVKYMHKKGCFAISDVQEASSVKLYFLEIGKVAFPVVTFNGSRRKVPLRKNYDSHYL